MSHHAHLEIHHAVGTHVGLRREVNEDSTYTSPRLLAVADGMGGHVHGEVASSIVTTAMADLDSSLGVDPQGADLLAAMSAGVAAASRRMTEIVGQDSAFTGMGSTLTALLWDGARFVLTHVGDSRAYLLRNGALRQITRDHTLVQSLIDAGRISPEQAVEHPRRAMLMRVLQSGSTTEPDLSLLESRPDDRYLLCSDGLTDVVPDSILHRTLTALSDPAEAIRRLITLANQAGGPDNITCIVVDVVASSRLAGWAQRFGCG